VLYGCNPFSGFRDMLRKRKFGKFGRTDRHTHRRVDDNIPHPYGRGIKTTNIDENYLETVSRYIYTLLFLHAQLENVLIDLTVSQSEILVLYCYYIPDSLSNGHTHA
jgi:hypothetical protein